jgi:hypothetical protein
LDALLERFVSDHGRRKVSVSIIKHRNQDIGGPTNMPKSSSEDDYLDTHKAEEHLDKLIGDANPDAAEIERMKLALKQMIEQAVDAAKTARTAAITDLESAPAHLQKKTGAGSLQDTKQKALDKVNALEKKLEDAKKKYSL